MTPKEALEGARGLIVRGWTRHSYIDTSPDEPPQYCAVGALRMACGGSVGFDQPAPYDAALRLLSNALPELSLYPLVRGADSETYRVTTFNDVIAKGPEDVIAVFDKAIAYGDGHWRRHE